MHQIAAIEERNHLHARRQNVLVQLLHLGVNRLQRGVRVRALAQQHDAFDHIGRCPSSSRRRAECAFPIWPSRIFGPCATVAMSRIRSGVPFCVLTTVFSMSSTSVEQADRAHVDLLQARFDEAAAGVDVVVRELLLHLPDAQAIRNQLVRDRAAPDIRCVVPPKLDTSTTFGTDLNCFSSVQSSSDFNSITSYSGFVLRSVYQ